MVSTGRPSDPYEEVITITSKSVDHRSHAYGTCATNGGQPRIRCSIGKKFSPIKESTETYLLELTLSSQLKAL